MQSGGRGVGGEGSRRLGLQPVKGLREGKEMRCQEWGMKWCQEWCAKLEGKGLHGGDKLRLRVVKRWK